jgi:hypothetical protein
MMMAPRSNKGLAMIILAYVLYKLTLASFLTTAPQIAKALAVAGIAHTIAQRRGVHALTAFDVSPL